ncbi:caspase family protein [Algibacter sp. AS12]|uniref:caspase family protein n=1 Tax=Algibacter sp. AS12 TaxID=3135773 RepID=UPI00398B83C2
MSTLKNAYALLIGIGNDLPVTVKDAKAIYNILADEKLAGYPPENIILLTEKAATRQGILDAFDALIQKTAPSSSVMLFYSGHGGFYEPWKQFYLVPNNFDPVNYESTWVKAEELREKIAQIKSKRLIFFLDCCHAAGMTKSVENASTQTPEDHLDQADGLAQRIDDGQGMSIVSSCRENQLSYILEGDSNSLYTKCLIEVLKGKHKNHFDEPFVRISEVVQYIFKKVPERNPIQNPYANLQIYDDFILSSIPTNSKNIINQTVTAAIEADKSAQKELITVYKETETANNVLLFVHGFSGDATESFGNIPNYLAKEKKLDGWDMFPLGYSKSVHPELGKSIWASKNDININTDYLKTSIKHKFGKYSRISIVAHSLGGLVVQRAILDLDKSLRDKISHVFLFGTPNNGLKQSTKNNAWQTILKDLSKNAPFIKTLRNDWKQHFKSGYPFTLKVISATHDEFVSVKSNFSAFNPEECVTVAGTHFSMVKQSKKDNDTYTLIKNTITNNSFSNTYTSEEEINILLGQYNTVINKLLPIIEHIDKRGLEQLIFALEGMGRNEEALSLLKTHPLAKNNSNLLGILAGRYKRKYLSEFNPSFGNDAIKFYSKALDIASEKKNYDQIYYHAINLAFLNLVIHQDYDKTKTYAQLAIDATIKTPLNNMWKLATLGEANLYLGDLETSKAYYAKASTMAGIREKISIHTNAFTAYTTMMNTENIDDEYIKFLKLKFLS